MDSPMQPLRLLGWLGRQGSLAIASLVLLGIALPPVDRILKPYVTAAIFILLCISFLRTDMNALMGYFRRPSIVLGATAWTTIGIPLLVGTIGRIADLDNQQPDLFLGLILQAVASPMMAAPAFAALMGLDATLVLASLILSTALVPLTAPVFAHIFIGPALAISSAALGTRLFLILSGAVVVGIITRRLLGPDLIERRSDEINGLNILVLFVFVSAVMENVGQQVLSHPLKIVWLTILAFGVSGALLISTALLFARFGRDRAMAIAFMASQRNMGLMVAATSGALPDIAWLFFGISQFPIYLAPLLLEPVVRKLRGTQDRANGKSVAHPEQ